MNTDRSFYVIEYHSVKIFPEGQKSRTCASRYLEFGEALCIKGPGDATELYSLVLSKYSIGNWIREMY